MKLAFILLMGLSPLIAQQKSDDMPDMMHEDAVAEVQLMHDQIAEYLKDNEWGHYLEHPLIQRVVDDLDAIEGADGELQFIADVRQMEADFARLQSYDKILNETKSI